RRRPAIAGLIGVSMVALLIVIVGGLWVNTSLKREKDDAQLARQEAEASEADAKKGRREAESAREWISQSLARVMQDQPPNEAVPWLADDLRRETSSRRRRQAAQRLASTIRASVKPSSIQFLESAPVRQLKISPRNELFVTSMSNGDLHRFDLATGQPIGKPITNGAPVQELEFNPISRRMMGFMRVEANSLLQVPKKSLVRFWDLETGKGESLKIDLEGEWIRHIGYSPDGQTIMLVVDDRVELRNSQTGELVFPGLLHQEAVLNASWNLEGTRIISVTEGAVVYRWDAGMGDSLGDPLQVPIAGDWKEVKFSTDRQLAILIGVRNAQLVTTSGGKLRGPLLEHEDEILFAGFSNDSQRLVTTSRDHTAQVWNTESGLALVSPFYHPDDVRQAAFDLSGKLLATACADRYLRVWNIERGEITGQPMVHRKGVNQVEFCGDGRRLLSTSFRRKEEARRGSDGTEIRLWDLANANQYSSLGVSTPTRHAFFVLRGNRILTVQDPVQQYSLESSERSPTLQLWDAASRENLFVASHPELPDAGPLHAYLDPTRRYLVTWSGATAWLWGIDTNQVMFINELSHVSDRGLKSSNDIAGVFVPGLEQSDSAAAAISGSQLLTFTAGPDVFGYTWPGKYKVWQLTNGQFVDRDFSIIFNKYIIKGSTSEFYLTLPSLLTLSQEMEWPLR
ncbi:MAG: WD40 repeat domain-containing protein, partial [Pirellulaceae bacterium]